ncbi:MAG: hypothetical protein HGA38_04795 [Candidatus Moranbacteria bacterium]|nr:hypothetical protein [Candidatus Moranbacteria bacterium]
MKNGQKRTSEKNTVDMRKNLSDESTVCLSVLMAVAGLFSVLLFSAARGSLYRIDTAAASVQAPSPRVRTVFERRIDRMVEGHPIEAMVPYIAGEDPETAKYLVSIAKHESNWGLHSPKDAYGQTCYNYWGFRGSGENVTPSGYSCFGSPKEAVAVVGSRISYLVHDLELDTPEELIVWKCGSTCAGHSGSDVRHWIGNVSLYSDRIERVAGAEASR